jgi:hypothetical protein
VSGGKADGDSSGILGSIKSSSVDQSDLESRNNGCATSGGAGGTDIDTNAKDFAITIDGGPGSSTSFGFSSDASITGYFVDDMLLDITATGTYVYENGKSIDLESTVGGYYYDDSSDTTYEYDFGGDNSVGVVQKCNNTKIKFNNVHGAHDGSPYSNDHDIQTVNTHKLPHSGDDIAVTLQLPVPGGDDGDCTDDLKFTGNVRIYDNNPLQNAALIQTDSDNIYTADDDPNFDDTDSSDHHWTASDISAPNNGTVFIQDCSTAISIDPDAAPVGPLEPNTDAADAQPNAVLYKTHKSSTDNSCVIDGSTAEPILIVLADDYQQNTNDNSNENAIPTNDASTDNVKAPSLDCHVHWYNPLSWFLCPLASGLASVAGGLDNAINKALTFNPNSLDPYEDSFHTIRNVALGLLVLGMLVAVISQALGMELLDAYTVRRVLPRLLIVALGIALAQPLIDFFINLSNGLGNGIRALIYAGASNSAGSGTVGFGGGAAFTENVLAGVGIAALGFVGVLSFAATAALAAAVGYLVLILRQMVIIALFIFAPIAFVAYLLPNTEKVWKMWWDSFSKALMMFPIIAGFIAIGRTFATITDNNLIAFVCYFGPYFALPLTFRFAGGALGALAGATHNSTAGMRGGLSKIRSRKAQQSFANAGTRVKEGNVFKHAPTGSLRERLNTGAMAIGAAGQAGINPRNWRGNIGAATARMSEQQRDKMLEDPEYSARGDDDWNRAASEAGSAAEFQRLMQTRNPNRYQGPGGEATLRRDVANYRTMESKYGRSGLRQASWIRAMAGGTAFGQGAEAWRAASAVAGGDRQVLASLVAKGREAAMGAGRVDHGGGSFGETFAIAQDLGNPASGVTMAQAQQRLSASVLDSQSADVIAHASMKPQAIENLLPEIQNRVENAARATQAPGTADQQRAAQEGYERELAHVANLHDGLARSSRAKADIIADRVLRRDPLHLTTAGPATATSRTVQQDMDAARSSTVFQSTRRELTAQEDAQRGPGGNPLGPASSPPPTSPSS